MHSNELIQYIENEIKPIDTNLYNDVNQLIKINTDEAEIVKVILQKIYKIEWVIIQRLKSICTDINTFSYEVFSNCLSTILVTSKAKVKLIKESPVIKDKSISSHIFLYIKISMAVDLTIADKLVDRETKIGSRMMFDYFQDEIENIFGIPDDY